MRYRNCKVKFLCMNDSRDFQDAESVRCGHSHVPVDQCPSRLVQFLKECQAVLLECQAVLLERAAKHVGHGWYTGKRFCKSSCVFFSNLIRRNSIHGVPEDMNHFTHQRLKRVRDKHQIKIRDTSLDSQPKVVIPSAGDFQELWCRPTTTAVIFSGGDSSKNYGADQQRLQISDLHFDKLPTPATIACWKIRFKTEVCTC